MKILDTYWFNGGGIVKVLDEYEGVKYFIRGYDPLDSDDEQTDAEFVANWGSTFPSDAGEVLFGSKK